MRVVIDSEAQTLEVTEGSGERRSLSLYDNEAFAILSDLWLRVGWELKYPYTFSWMGRPLIQLPEDVLRIQEVIYRVRPDVLVETGVAHGGSLVFYASLFAAMGRGRVVGVDVEIRPHNRKAIEAHEMASRIDLVEGDSIADATVTKVKELVGDAATVLVVLDSNHSRAHVAAELERYGPLVTVGSYIVATDGIMATVAHVPRGQSGWTDDNPSAAAREFASRHPEFVLEQPAWPFNESGLDRNVTHWPDAWLRRVGTETP